MPTLLSNGFGARRIEGIGVERVPWIHNVKNTDMVMAVDDEVPIQIIRLVQQAEGRKYLAQMGVPQEFDQRTEHPSASPARRTSRRPSRWRSG